MLKSKNIFIIIFFLSNFIFAQDSYAYLDPGTGSYIFQVFIAGILGGLFAVKMFWQKIKDFFRNLFLDKKNQ